MKEDNHIETNTLWFCSYEAPRVVKFMETESKMVDARRWGSCIMDTEFQLCKVKRGLDVG